MSNHEHALSSKGGRVQLSFDRELAVVRLCNPSARNSITSAMRSELREIFGDLKSSSASAVVLTGFGPHFSSGMDIVEMTADNANAIADDMVTVEDHIVDLPMPTIAAIEGFCIGGGTQLALACDLRIVAAQSKIAITPAKIGIVYPAASIRRLLQITGPAVAKFMLFTADQVDAEQALAFGMAHQVVSEGRAFESAQQLAATIGSRSPLSVRAAKSIIDAPNAERGDDLETAWRHVVNNDISAGLNAFIRKTPPIFAAQHNS